MHDRVMEPIYDNLAIGIMKEHLGVGNHAGIDTKLSNFDTPEPRTRTANWCLLETSGPSVFDPAQEQSRLLSCVRPRAPDLKVLFPTVSLSGFA